ncbi:GGDEF domain-containing protein [Anaerovorax odorimutans]|uniref:GGDEF domain-containing protein n=1 Tax=Anaerovorax odorimutans TaxID=109327 RepID=A0ABT1RPA8_9FIRM|nr:GGDEF domain-containing protein [Anaerovorax odorimutans]MCQ4637027.1 GGDEF domain-containing protein [Anaerovorax odorimutans]
MVEKIKDILYMDRYILERESRARDRNQRGIAVIAAAVFVVMSLLNIKQHSSVMLATTSLSAVFLVIGYFLSKYKGNSKFLRGMFYLIFMAVFTLYTVMGGNEGFAALWLLVATYAVMISIDFRVGFIISAYHFVMLMLVFIGPLNGLLQYAYNETFMLRFPFLFVANFAFATYIAIRIRSYQYALLLKQEELEYFNTIDLSTGLLNRNRFIKDVEAFQAGDLNTLSAVFIDVNGLHGINNRHGHSAGDSMLREIANLCKDYFPDNDIYRMGGDEFLILCKNESEEAVTTAARLLYEAVEQAGYSISYGVETQDADFDLDKVVRDADEKMIAFKKEYYRCRRDEAERVSRN